MVWTVERHKAAKARCDAATPGPWAIRGDEPFARKVETRTREPHGFTGVAFSQVQDAQFVAHARQDLPDALKEIEILQMDLCHAREFMPRLFELARDAFEASEYPDTEPDSEWLKDWQAIQLASEWLKDFNTIQLAKVWLANQREESE